MMEPSELQPSRPQLLGPGVCILECRGLLVCTLENTVTCPKTCVTPPVESGKHTVIKTHEHFYSKAF